MFSAFGPSPFSDSESDFGPSFGTSAGLAASREAADTSAETDFGSPFGGGSSAKLDSSDKMRSIGDGPIIESTYGDYQDDSKVAKRQLAGNPGGPPGFGDGNFAVPSQFQNLGAVSEPAGLTNPGQFQVSI